jgi:hypothetical protein
MNGGMKLCGAQASDGNNIAHNLTQLFYAPLKDRRRMWIFTYRLARFYSSQPAKHAGSSGASMPFS